MTKARNISKKSKRLTGTSHSAVNAVQNNQDADWISALAKKSSIDDPTLNLSSNKILSKQERIEKRKAKKRKRDEQRTRGSLVPAAVDHQLKDARPWSKKEQIVGADRKRQEKQEMVLLEHQDTTKRDQVRLKKLSLEIQDSVERLCQRRSVEERKYVKPFQPLHERGKAAPGHQLSQSVIQPRKKDYGGLGLARPSLLLDLRDVSFIPKLEEEFSEHVPGFFGKQRTKAMKRQLDGNMLWRRLVNRGKGGQDDPTKNIKVNGKKLSEMSPDERVEAMIQLNII